MATDEFDKGVSATIVVMGICLVVLIMAGFAGALIRDMTYDRRAASHFPCADDQVLVRSPYDAGRLICIPITEIK